VEAVVTVNVADTLLPVLLFCVATTVCVPALADGTMNVQPATRFPPLFTEHVATSVPFVVLSVPSQ
jgi:hypothetical protein